LSEARDAYRFSLELEPDSGTAKDQLAYIHHLLRH